MSEIKININGKDIVTDAGKSILQAAAENGIEIPHLCYDERIKPYGACGLCVVEVEGVPKLLRACATNVSDGQIIKTDTPRTKATRKSALKLLVSDHRGDCRPPCVLACPAQTDCQGYAGLIANGEFKEALSLVKEKIPIPASIGRVCPHPCETACRRSMVEEPVSIAGLKTFIADLDLKGETYVADIKPSTGKKVAVIGAGPAGLTSAYFLTREGHKVTIFEAMPKPGGMLRYGIPEYRLPKAVLDEEVKLIENMGVDIKYNTRLGQDITIEELKKEFDVVFIGIGAWKSSSMRCKGETLQGVIGGIDFLREVSMNGTAPIGKKVLVVGGGNTAMDVARTAVRLGAEKVSVIYRRTKDEMPAEEIEISEAEEEGVEFNYLVAPVEVIDNEGKAAGLLCQRMKLGEPDASGRCKPVPIEGAEITFDADTVIAAIGQQVNAGNIKGLNLSKYGTIEAQDGTFETNIPGVFAGGDAVTGPKIAIDAVAQGKAAAEVIDSYLNGKAFVGCKQRVVKQDDLTENDFKDRIEQPRVKHHVLSPEKRRSNFNEVASTMTEEEAKKEASRCLECGCRDYFECQLLKYINDYDIDTEKTKGEKHKRMEKDNHPFIERNADKCILCGLCVRACDEVMGVTALGLVSRGFDTIVKPEFGLPLKESDCISCGLCVSVCPTGACMEKEAAVKQVPVDFDRTESVCGFCGVGCNLVLETKGETVFRALPDKACGYGLLCSRGRFGINVVNSDSRLKKPLVKNNNVLVETDWSSAVEKLSLAIDSINEKYGKDSVAFAVSRGVTNEEAYIIRKIADKLGTGLVGSFTEYINAPNGSSAKYDDIDDADVIISLGNITENHPVLGTRIRNAVKNNAKLISVSGKPSRDREWADVSITSSNSTEFLFGIVNALSKKGIAKETKENAFENIKAAALNVDITEEMEVAADLCIDAKNVVIVIDEDTSANEIYSIAEYISRRYCSENVSVIIARSKCNTQGTLDMGIVSHGSEIIKRIEEGTVKALVILGEDPSDLETAVLNKLEFVAVFDGVMTKTAKTADIVLPFASFAESTGSFTNSENKIQSVKAGIDPLSGKENIDVLIEMARSLKLAYNSLADVQAAIASEVEGYGLLLKIDSECCGLYTDKNVNLTGDGIAETKIPAFIDKPITDTLESSFRKYCNENDITL